MLQQQSSHKYARSCSRNMSQKYMPEMHKLQAKKNNKTKYATNKSCLHKHKMIIHTSRQGQVHRALSKNLMKAHFLHKGFCHVCGAITALKDSTTCYFLRFILTAIWAVTAASCSSTTSALAPQSDIKLS